MDRKNVRLGWIPDPPDKRDYIYPLKLSPDKLPTKVDLTEKYSVPVVDQGDLGSCTGNGIASAIAYLEQKEGEPFVYPSRLFIYYNERVMEGTVQEDAGANIRDGIKSVVQQGFCPETDWPYVISKFTVKPSDAAYADALLDTIQTYQKVPVNTASIMTALAQGYAVIVGITVYDSFMGYGDGNIPMPDITNESVQGGHCVIVVGYDQQTSRFKFQNSWGSSWGTSGFGTLPFAYLGDPYYGGDYWIVTADTPPVGPGPAPKPAPAPGCLLGLLLLPVTLILKFLG